MIHTEQLALPAAGETHDTATHTVANNIGSLTTPVGAEVVYGRDLNSSDTLFFESRDSGVLEEICDDFGMGQISSRDFPYHHTTTSRKVVLHAARGSYFLKQKADYCSDPDRVEFTSRFQNAMASSMPEVPVLLTSATTAEPYMRHGNRFYIATEYIAGEPYRNSEGQLKSAARTLARLHNSSIDFTEALHEEPEKKDSRTDAIAFIRMAGELEGSELDKYRVGVIEELLAHVDHFSGLQEDKDGLTRIITHGDFTASNLLFDAAGNVISVNDFDNAGYNIRIRDVAEAIMTFCGGVNYKGNTSNLRTPICERIDPNMAADFYTTYTQGLERELTDDERKGIVNEIGLAWCELMALGIVRGDFNYGHVQQTGFRFIKNLEQLRHIFAS